MGVGKMITVIYVKRVLGLYFYIILAGINYCQYITCDQRKEAMYDMGESRSEEYFMYIYFKIRIIIIQ
jgi:hypothetical protein